MNKEKALEKIKDLESEMKKLKIIIEQSEDLFSKINNYSDVCKELGEDELIEDNYKFLHRKDRKSALAFGKFKQIQRLFNGDWLPKFDSTQENWYPYFTSSSGGFLVYDGSDSVFTYCIGALGFFKDKKTAEFIGKTFMNEIYREVYK